MEISFDLDSTLIPNGKEFKTEHLNKIARVFGIEEIRRGAPKLIYDLQNKGHRIHIYTTSFRSKIRIRSTLKFYGINVNSIINQSENQRVLNLLKINSSKYPPAFNLDLHIDDLRGVGIESERFNFKVIIVDPRDDNWAQKIMKEVSNYPTP